MIVKQDILYCRDGMLLNGFKFIDKNIAFVHKAWQKRHIYYLCARCFGKKGVKNSNFKDISFFFQRKIHPRVILHSLQLNLIFL